VDIADGFDSVKRLVNRATQLDSNVPSVRGEMLVDAIKSNFESPQALEVPVTGVRRQAQTWTAEHPPERFELRCFAQSQEK